ncbi:MAG TPA: SDR family oxidoreductase [Longimicrobiales bacterium]|nr:SDR family oxidoreductase [Longimicrobiales bacterium]
MALVTGGARRVGRALSLALAEAGADLVVGYHRSASDADTLVEEVRALGRRAVAVQGDVASKTDVDALVRACEAAFGRLDILVNNAAGFESAPFLEITEEEWDRVMAVNLKGPFLLSQAATPLLRAHGDGIIVNIADLAGLQAWPGYAHHGASKAGLIHLTRVAARALAPEIRVAAIAPGTVLPPETFTEEQVYKLREAIPLKRIGSPDDVAEALLYLVRSDFVTGIVIPVDGGRLLV